MSENTSQQEAQHPAQQTLTALAEGGVGDGFAGGFGERVVFGVDFAAGEGGLTGV